MKMKKAYIYMNGKYLESHKCRTEAEAAVRRYEREDRYERDTEGYTNPLPIYEVRDNR